MIGTVEKEKNCSTCRWRKTLANFKICEHKESSQRFAFIRCDKYEPITEDGQRGNDD